VSEDRRPTGRDPIVAEPDSLVGRACSVCQTAIDRGEAACLCPACRTPYHRSCWEEIGGCATYGCQCSPEPVKPPRDESGAREAWGDEKICPNCGQQILSAAVKCRFCRAKFPSATHMTGPEYQALRQREAELGPTRTWAVVFFIVSLMGVLAPAVVLAGGLWLWRSHGAIKRAGGVHQVFAYFAVGLSLIYCVVLAAFVM